MMQDMPPMDPVALYATVAPPGRISVFSGARVVAVLEHEDGVRWQARPGLSVDVADSRRQTNVSIEPRSSDLRPPAAESDTMPSATSPFFIPSPSAAGAVHPWIPSVPVVFGIGFLLGCMVMFGPHSDGNRNSDSHRS